MTNPKAKKYLFDVLLAIDQIEHFLGSKRDFSIYQQDAMLRSAVERQLITIGEAVNRLRQLDENIALTSSRTIVQFRNRITHEYDKVDDVNVWAIVIKHLPVLKQEIQQLLNSVP
jgi:uncharacterized protein with HEPN domain